MSYRLVRHPLRRLYPLFSFFLAAGLAFLLLYPPPSGWDFDNTFTALKTLRGQGVAEVWEGIGKGDAHPPGYYLLYKAWMALGGYDPLPPGVPEGAIRWGLTFNLLGFALMAGAVALAGAYLLGLWGGLLALGFLFLFADAPYASLMRMYPFAGALAVLSALAYLTRRLLLGSLLGVLGLYTHYLAGVAVAPFALLALWEGWRERGPRVALAFLPYLLFLPWVPMLAYQVSHGYNFPHIRPVPESLFLYVRDKWPEGVLYPLLLLGLLAAWRIPKTRRILLPTLASLYLWFYLSLLVNVVLSRYLFLFAGLISLALASGVSLLPPWGRRAVALVVLVPALLTLHFQRTLLPWEDITAQARITRGFLVALEEARLYLDGWGRADSFRLHLPGFEGRVVVLNWLDATELCGTGKPFLLWRYHNYRPEESPVQRVLECLGGRAHVLHPTPVGTLYLYVPEGYQSTAVATRNRQR